MSYRQSSFFQAEDGIRDYKVTGVQTCALPIWALLEAGLLHGDCITVTGKTMAENLAKLDPPAPDGDVIHPIDRPVHSAGGIAILTGSLAPKGAVVKVAGLDDLAFEG